MKTNFNAPPDRLPPAKNLKFSDTDSPHCIFAEIFLVLTEKSHKKAPDPKVSGFF